MKTIKIIGRISQTGKEYLQTALNHEGAETEFIPVFVKKSVEKFEYISQERKVDKAGKVYTLYEVYAKNVFFPKVENDEKKHAVIMK